MAEIMSKAYKYLFPLAGSTDRFIFFKLCMWKAEDFESFSLGDKDSFFTSTGRGKNKKGKNCQLIRKNCHFFSFKRNELCTILVKQKRHEILLFCHTTIRFYR